MKVSEKLKVFRPDMTNQELIEFGTMMREEVAELEGAAILANKAISKILETGGLDILTWWDAVVTAQVALGKKVAR